MAAFDLPDQVGPPRQKPEDCTCRFPDAIARNPTGHAKRCPAYARLWAEATGDKGEYVNPRNVLPDSLTGEPFSVPLVPSSALPQGVLDAPVVSEHTRQGPRTDGRPAGGLPEAHPGSLLER